MKETLKQLLTVFILKSRLQSKLFCSHCTTISSFLFVCRECLWCVEDDGVWRGKVKILALASSCIVVHDYKSLLQLRGKSLQSICLSLIPEKGLAAECVVPIHIATVQIILHLPSITFCKPKKKDKRSPQAVANDVFLSYS